MNPEKMPEPGKQIPDGDKTFMNEMSKKLVEQNVGELHEGRPEEWGARLEALKKQRKEVRPLKKDETKTLKPCRHCGSSDHRSYACPRLEDPKYKDDFMKQVPGYPPKESQDKS